MSLENRTPATLLKAGFLALTAIAVRLEQPANAPLPMVVTLAGIVTLVNCVSKNALSPMEVTLPGIVTLVS
jgi:hypothetical protein